MALRNARDVYTRRRRACRSGSCRPPRSPRPARTRRTRSSTRPRQGLPAPDVLRRPGRGGAPVNADDRRSAAPVAAPPYAYAAARRRRAGPRPAARRVDRPRPAARGGRRARQHRARPARPGALAADLRRRGRGRRPGPRTTSPTCATSATSCNVQLVELPSGDFARHDGPAAGLLDLPVRAVPRLLASTDATLAGVAAKAVKEVDYHRDHATQWVLRLGDGTDESHRRMQAGLERIWPYVDELFDTDDLERDLVAEASPSTTAAARRRGTPTSVSVLAEATLVRARGRLDAATAVVGAASTPRRSATCSPRCSTCTAPTRGRRGERRTDDRETSALETRQVRPPRRCSTRRCRC